LQQLKTFDPIFIRASRLMRLPKMFRIIHVLRIFVELRLMLKCMIGPMLSMVWSFALIGGLTFLFSIVFVNQFTSMFIDERDGLTECGHSVENLSLLCEAHESFGSVGQAMLTLFKLVTQGDDWGRYYAMAEKTGTFTCIFLIFYIMFTWMSVTNIITGIFVDKAMKLARPDVDQLLYEKHQKDLKDAEEMKNVFELLDLNRDGKIHFDEFKRCMKNEKLISHCELKGIDIKDTVEFFKMLTCISGQDTLDVDTFVSGCMMMKGVAMTIDLITLKFEMKLLGNRQNDLTKKILIGLERIHEMLEPAAI